MFNDKIVLGSINVLQAAASNNAYVEGSLAKNQATLAYLALCQLPLANMLHTYITSISDDIFGTLHAVAPVELYHNAPGGAIT